MDEIDRALLATLPPRAVVALLPTASGLEPGSPERWNALGERHFAALGAPTLPLRLLRRDDAADETILAALREARFFYFSGGNPNHVIETLQGTPAWSVIHQALAAGAAIAGCSAGAMMLGGVTVRLRDILAGGPPSWMPALGVVPEVAVLPHFDRFASRWGLDTIRRLADEAPDGLTVLGIDEDTALIRLRPDEPWRAAGRQTVSVFRAGQPVRVLRSGETIVLDPD
jgi:cyanophycinase-like exopeptidase